MTPSGIALTAFLAVMAFWVGWICGTPKPSGGCDADSHDYDLIFAEGTKASFVCLDCGKKLVVEF